MVKRKQPDFQKTRLKVGKTLPKGRNVTDTSFKTKQIITPEQLFVALADKPLTALLNYLNTNNVAQKLDTLKKIHTYITEHQDNLFLYFPEVLSKLGNAALESDPAVPDLAVKIITTCLKHLSDIQYQSFSKTVLLHLNCMMSHGALTVKKTSLQLLEALLATHPKVVTQQPKILCNLLNMISAPKGQQKFRRLDDPVNNKMTSCNWHQAVLQIVSLFLRTMLEPEGDKEKEGPREIYWDGKSDLYLPLYAASGPDSLKVDFSWYSSISPPDDSKFKEFIFQLLELLSDVLKGQFHYIARKQQDVVLIPADAKYLNLIVQLLCYAGELSQQNLQFEENEVQEISERIRNILYYQLLNGYPYAQHDPAYAKKGLEKQEQESVQVNFSICYLNAMFILESNDIKPKISKKDIYGHFNNMVQVCNFSDRSLAIILKTCRILMKSDNYEILLKDSTMGGIFTMYKACRHSVESKMLRSFFIDLSLDDRYRGLLESLGMINWFDNIFTHELNDMITTNVFNMELLQYYNQLCCRKYPIFMEILNGVDKKTLLKMLKVDNEDFQITIIRLILARDGMQTDFLQDLSDLICQGSTITLKMSVRLIYQLHTRFSRPDVSVKDQILFVKFLLNVACDTWYVSQASNEANETGVKDIHFGILNFLPYRIYPTKKWKTHQKIFEVCLECLLPYCVKDHGKSALFVFAMSFLNLHFRCTIPVHVVLAFLLVKQKIGCQFRDDMEKSSKMLIFSSLMYISVITNNASDQAKVFCVPELLKCFIASLAKCEVTNLLLHNQDVFLKSNENVLLYALRVLMFLNIRDKIDKEDPYINHLFQELANRAPQSSQVLAPVWYKLCNAI